MLRRWLPSCLVLVTAVVNGQALFAQAAMFRRGDANADGRVNLSDGVSTLRFLFQGAEVPRCRDAADADDSGSLNLSDVIYTFRLLFQNGPLAVELGECGVDPTDDALDCRNYQPLDPALDCDGARNLAPAPGAGAVHVGPGVQLQVGGAVLRLEVGLAAQPQAGAAGGPQRVSVLVHLAVGANRGPIRQFGKAALL